MPGSGSVNKLFLWKTIPETVRVGAHVTSQTHVRQVFGHPWGLERSASYYARLNMVIQLRIPQKAGEFFGQLNDCQLVKQPIHIPHHEPREPVHTVMPHFLTTHFNIILPSTSSSLKMSLPFAFCYQDFVCLSHFSHEYYAPQSIPNFRNSINIPPPQHPVLNTLNMCSQINAPFQIN
jgi:hypothetical protein